MSTFLPTQFNPEITVAQEARLIQIANTHIWVDLVLTWDHKTNVWKSYYHAKRWTHSCVSSTTHDLGVFESLSDAVDRCCKEAGISATDPQYRQKEESRRQLRESLAHLEQVKKVLGRSSEIETLIGSCNEELKNLV